MREGDERKFVISPIFHGVGSKGTDRLGVNLKFVSLWPILGSFSSFGRFNLGAVGRASAGNLTNRIRPFSPGYIRS